MMEVVQSIRLCEQAMAKYAKLQAEWEAVQKEHGEEAAKDPKGAAAAKLNELARTKYSHRGGAAADHHPREVYVETECPRGKMGFHIVGSRTRRTYRYGCGHGRAASANLSGFEKLWPATC